MAVNHNDMLEIFTSNIELLDYKLNPFIKKIIEFLIVFLDEGDNKKELYSKFNKYGNFLVNNSDELFKLIKLLIPHGILDEYIVRYSYAKLDNQNKKNPISFHITKYKFIGDTLYLYDETLSDENRNYLEIKEINGININELILNLKNKGFNHSEIEVLLLHKEIITALGFQGDKDELGVLSNGKLVKLQLDGDEHNIDFSILAKKHERAKILEKSNFILANNRESAIENQRFAYAHDSCLKLLAILHGMSKSDKDLKLIEQISTRMNDILLSNEVSDKYVDWMLISSFFLLNREEKSILPEYIYTRLEQKINGSSNYRVDYDNLSYELIPFCIFLDENNNEVSFSFNTSEEKLSANSYIWDKNLQKVNYRMLFHSIRNALAHSSYEVIDENYIRVFGTDNAGNLNVNMKINKEIIVEFIGKLSDYSSLGNIFPVCTLIEPNFENRSIKNKKELRDYLINLQISDVVIKKYYDLEQSKKESDYKLINENPIINNVAYVFDRFENDYEYMIQKINANLVNITTINQDDVERIVIRLLTRHMDFDFNKMVLSEEQINSIMEKISLYSDVFYNQGATNQHIILTRLIKEELNPSQIVTDSLYELIRTEKKVDGSIMDSLDETSIKYINYSSIIKACIIAYLNSILLYSYNENKTLDCSNLDFSSMLINKDLLIERKKKRINDLNNNSKNEFYKCEKLKKYIEDLGKKIKYGKLNDKKKNEIEQQILDTKNKLAVNIEDYNNKKMINDLEISELKLDLKKIESDEFDINEYILEHLRHSLAHGNISFMSDIDINNIANIELTFTDFYPRSKRESFGGTIKLSDLLTILSDKKYVQSLYNDNNITY